MTEDEFDLAGKRLAQEQITKSGMVARALSKVFGELLGKMLREGKIVEARK